VAEGICDIDYVDEARVARVMQRLPGEDACRRAAGMFKLLADPTRVRGLLAMTVEPLCVCDLSRLLNVSRSALSHQLRLLRTAGLVRTKRKGKMVYYSLEADGIRKTIMHALTIAGQERPEGEADGDADR